MVSPPLYEVTTDTGSLQLTSSHVRFVEPDAVAERAGVRRVTSLPLEHVSGMRLAPEDKHRWRNAALAGTIAASALWAAGLTWIATGGAVLVLLGVVAGAFAGYALHRYGRVEGATLGLFHGDRVLAVTVPVDQARRLDSFLENLELLQAVRGAGLDTATADEAARRATREVPAASHVGSTRRRADRASR